MRSLETRLCEGELIIQSFGLPMQTIQKTLSKYSLPGAVKYAGEQKLDSPNVLLTEAVKVYISPTESPSIRHSTLVLSP